MGKRHAAAGPERNRRHATGAAVEAVVNLGSTPTRMRRPALVESKVPVLTGSPAPAELTQRCRAWASSSARLSRGCLGERRAWRRRADRRRAEPMAQLLLAQADLTKTRFPAARNREG